MRELRRFAFWILLSHETSTGFRWSDKASGLLLLAYDASARGFFDSINL